MPPPAFAVAFCVGVARWLCECVMVAAVGMSRPWAALSFAAAEPVKPTLCYLLPTYGPERYAPRPVSIQKLRNVDCPMDRGVGWLRQCRAWADECTGVQARPAR